jgi:lipoate-protein ligase B
MSEMQERQLEVRRLGRISYEDSLDIQKKAEADVIENRAADYLFLLEHPHTYTIGRRSSEQGVLATEEILKQIDAQVFEVNRGGKVTYHGIGQLVGYPIINLTSYRQDVHFYVRQLEEVLIKTLDHFGIESFRIEGLTGVHTKEGKIAAIGVHIKRWVTTHGFALNVSTELDYFNWIIACEGEPVTSMERILGKEISLEEVDRVVEKYFRQVFEYTELEKN